MDVYFTLIILIIARGSCRFLLKEDFDSGANGWTLRDSSRSIQLDKDPIGKNGIVLVLNTCRKDTVVSPKFKCPNEKCGISYKVLGSTRQGFVHGNLVFWAAQSFRENVTSGFKNKWDLVQYEYTPPNGFSKDVLHSSHVLFDIDTVNITDECRNHYVDQLQIFTMPNTSSGLKQVNEWPVIIIIVSSILLILILTFLFCKRRIRGPVRSIIFNPEVPSTNPLFVDFQKEYESKIWHKRITPIRTSEIKRTGEQLGEGNSSEVWKYMYNAGPVAGKSLKDDNTEGAVSSQYPTIDNETKCIQSIDEKEVLSKYEHELFVIETMGNHENIIQLNGYVNELKLIVLFYMPAKSVFDYMTGHDIDAENKLKIMRSAAAGLVHMHSKRVVHRDISMRNVLLRTSKNGKVAQCVLSDFEMSLFLKPNEMQSQAKSNWGPIACMAPEAFHKWYSTKTDTYMFSLLVYALCSENLPWLNYINDELYLDLQQRVAEGGRPRISWDVDDYPTFTDLMRNCWANDPSERPEMTIVLQRLTAMSTADIPPKPSNSFIGGRAIYTRCDV
jgi:hypothetical protein